MDFRLTLDRDQVDRCRRAARAIALHLRRFVVEHTSDAIERSVLRAMGVEGFVKERPLTEIVLEKIGKDRVREGAAYWLGAVMVARECDALTAAQWLAQHELPQPSDAKNLPHGEIRRVTREAFAQFPKRVEAARSVKQRAPQTPAERSVAGPQIMAAICTGQMEYDVRALHDAAKQVSAVVVRSPLPLNDNALVGKGKGWRVRYRVIESLEKISEAAGASLDVAWSGLHLQGPEQAVAFATTGLSAFEYDAFTMTHVGGVHFKRALVDQQWIFHLLGKIHAQAMVSCDRWREPLDCYSQGHELVMGQMLIEALGASAGLPRESMIARHGRVTLHGESATRPDALLCELAFVEMVREIFPQVPLALQIEAHGDAASVSISTALAILCDVATAVVAWPDDEKNTAAHYQATRAAMQQLTSILGSVVDDLSFEHNGKISRRAHTMLERMEKSFELVERRDLLNLVEPAEQLGLFAIADRGVGQDGVYLKHKYYWNPMADWLEAGSRELHSETHPVESHRKSRRESVQLVPRPQPSERKKSREPRGGKSRGGAKPAAKIAAPVAPAVPPPEIAPVPVENVAAPISADVAVVGETLKKKRRRGRRGGRRRRGRRDGVSTTAENSSSGDSPSATNEVAELTGDRRPATDD